MLSLPMRHLSLYFSVHKVAPIEALQRKPLGPTNTLCFNCNKLNNCHNWSLAQDKDDIAQSLSTLKQS